MRCFAVLYGSGTELINFTYLPESGGRNQRKHKFEGILPNLDRRYRETALTLGAGPVRTAWMILREARFAVSAALCAAFGRGIAEVGVAMMLGGNIKGFTRTMTTAMALEYDKGSFTLAIALGLVLMGISLFINIVFNLIQGHSRR